MAKKVAEYSNPLLAYREWEAVNKNRINVYEEVNIRHSGDLIGDELSFTVKHWLPLPPYIEVNTVRVSMSLKETHHREALLYFLSAYRVTRVVLEGGASQDAQFLLDDLIHQNSTIIQFEIQAKQYHKGNKENTFQQIELGSVAEEEDTDLKHFLKRNLQFHLLMELAWDAVHNTSENQDQKTLEELIRTLLNTIWSWFPEKNSDINNSSVVFQMIDALSILASQITDKLPLLTQPPGPRKPTSISP